MNIRLTIIAAAATAAASIALYPLIAGAAWFWAGAGAIVVTATVGALTRLRVIPAVACLLAVLAAEFLYLNALFAGPQSWARLVPTPASTDHLGWLLSQAMTEASRYAPPVPAHHGVVLLAAGGTGLAAAATDLLAVRLHRPAIAGLPLLVLFCVPLTTGAGPRGLAAATVFCIAVAGYLALLSADGRQRLRLWGRVVRTWYSRNRGRDPDTRQLSASGRRIGLAAVLIALCVPLVLPVVPHRLFASSGGVGSPFGTGPVSLPQPLVQLNNDLHASKRRVVLTYHTSDASPPYLQVYVLSRLGTNAWTLVQPAHTVPLGRGTLPAVPGMSAHASSAQVHETISTSGDLVGEALPVPYAPRSLNVPGRWTVGRNSLTVFSAGTRLAGLRYTVTSRVPSPTPQELINAAPPPSAVLTYLTYPSVFTQLQGLANRITAGRTTALGKAVALQDWFRAPGRFTYTLNVSEPRKAGDLIKFLTKTRRGYCQQFAFAMAVLARLVGIPSRVVVGYTQGTYLGQDTWTVTTADAHAWPELYFPGFGWLGFEPTPGGIPGDGGQATATVPSYAFLPVSSGSGNGSTPQSQAGGSSQRATAGRHLPATDHGLQQGQAGQGAHHPAGTPPVGLLVIVLAGLVLVTPRATRSITRRRRWLMAGDDTRRAHAAWNEFCDDLADHRIIRRPSETPRAVARRLSRTVDLADGERQALGRITRAEERACYATAPVPSASLRADVATLRRAVARASAPSVRWAARALPPSVLTRARTALRNSQGLVGWADAVRARSLRRGGARAGN